MAETKQMYYLTISVGPKSECGGPDYLQGPPTMRQGVRAYILSESSWIPLFKLPAFLTELAAEASG